MYAYVTTDAKSNIRDDSTITVNGQTVPVPTEVTLANGVKSKIGPNRVAAAIRQLGYELIRGEVTGDETHVKLPIRSLTTGK